MSRPATLTDIPQDIQDKELWDAFLSDDVVEVFQEEFSKRWNLHEFMETHHLERTRLKLIEIIEWRRMLRDVSSDSETNNDASDRQYCIDALRTFVNDIDGAFITDPEICAAMLLDIEPESQRWRETRRQIEAVLYAVTNLKICLENPELLPIEEPDSEVPQ